MDNQELKMIMRSKARLAKGFVNLLKDDAECIYGDVNELDMERLDEDIKELKRTAQQLVDVVTDIEYYMYLAITGRVKNN
jgi:hypothetical protein